MSDDDSIPVTQSGGNVFADLGLNRPEEEQLKAQLVRDIRDMLKRQRLTQAQAAELLGLQQPDVVALVDGRVGQVTLKRLLRYQARLRGRDDATKLEDLMSALDAGEASGEDPESMAQILSAARAELRRQWANSPGILGVDFTAHRIRKEVYRKPPTACGSDFDKRVLQLLARQHSGGDAPAGLLSAQVTAKLARIVSSCEVCYKPSE